MSLGYINGNRSEVPGAFSGDTVTVGGVVYGWSDALGRYVAPTPGAWDGSWDFLGDSITAGGAGWNNDGNGNLTEVNGGRYSPGGSHAAFANFALWGGMRFARNWGFGGMGAAYMITQLPMILASPSKNVLLMDGTNEFQNADALTVRIETFRTLLRSLIAGGKRVFVVLSPPMTSAAPTAWNAAVSTICIAEGVPYADPWGAIINADTGLIKNAVYMMDTKHPKLSTNAEFVGPRLARSLIPYVGARVHPSSNLDCGVVANGCMATSSAGVATGWTASADASVGMTPTVETPSAVTDACSRTQVVNGNIQKLVATDIGANANGVQLFQTLSGLVPGQEYEASFYMRVDKLVKARLVFRIHNAFTDATTWCAFDSTNDQNNSQDAVTRAVYEGVYVCRFVAPAAGVTTYIRWQATRAGSLDLRVGMVRIVPV